MPDPRPTGRDAALALRDGRLDAAEATHRHVAGRRYFKLQRVQSCRAARAAAFASMFAVFCGGGLQRRVLGQDGGDLPCRDSL